MHAPHSIGVADNDDSRLLALQSEYWEAFTLDALRRAGIAPGMRVLDLGCGDGALSMAAASLVGPAGEVVGVDRDAELVERATARAAASELANIEFVASELRMFEPPGTFDAFIGRFVLMHLADPSASLRRLTPALRHGGAVAFVELDWVAARTVPSVPLVEDTLALIRDSLRRAGIATDLGPRLWRIYRTIGIREIDVRIETRAEPAPAPHACELIAETVRSILPLVERFGLARASDVDLDTLASRLRDALLERQATLLPPTAAGATGRLFT
jgi:SAM-dependent methyltransferase